WAPPGTTGDAHRCGWYYGIIRRPSEGSSGSMSPVRPGSRLPSRSEVRPSPSPGTDGDAPGIDEPGRGDPLGIGMGGRGAPSGIGRPSRPGLPGMGGAGGAPTGRPTGTRPGPGGALPTPGPGPSSPESVPGAPGRTVGPGRPG